MDKKLLGKKINISRKDKGLTSEKLSELCNINATYLRQIESGAKMPSLPVFISICRELKVSRSYQRYRKWTYFRNCGKRHLLNRSRWSIP